MREIKIKNFKDEAKTVKDVFKRYCANQIKLKYIGEARQSKPDVEVKEITNYCGAIDDILQNIDLNCANLLKIIYIEHKDAEAIGYSRSYLYRKMAVAHKEFMEYYGYVGCN
ncbi:MAG: hypothetical protein LBM76_01665 [Mycoplasmataceae bacterium]|jgi:hypothetical protein|nr:hypothetical protein [Mycoplasmataceae bacterium]